MCLHARTMYNNKLCSIYREVFIGHGYAMQNLVHSCYLHLIRHSLTRMVPLRIFVSL